MLIRLTGGHDGIREYLETGRKDGREFARDELDERIVLAGDLEATNAVIQSIDSAGDRYLHITLAFKEDHIPTEALRSVVDEFETFAFTAYRKDEYSYYAEAHDPRIKSYVHRRTGAFVERKPHIHVVIPDRNLLTGRRLGLFGKVTQQERFIDAFQEHINNRFGFSSPKDNRRIEFTDASEVLARYKGDVFAGRHAELRGSLLAALIVRDIRTFEQFKTLASEHGAVRIRNEGKPNQYLNVQRAGEKGINLKDYVFSREFIELSQTEKRAALTREVQHRYEEVGAAKRDPTAITDTLSEWHTVRAKEIKYLNSGNKKLYAGYRAVDRGAQLELLAERETRYYAKHDPERIDGPPQHGDLERLADSRRASGRQFESARRNKHHQDRLATSVFDKLRRPADNVIGQLQHQISEDRLLQHIKTRPDIMEIKRTLDARRLLSTVAASHGVIVEKYGIAPGKDGGDRIVCGARHLNVSDFLTRELKLHWAKAEIILREVHAAQRAQAPARNVPSEPKQSPLWTGFHTWKNEYVARGTVAWKGQRAKEKERRRANAAALETARSRIYADTGAAYGGRRAAMSIARMKKVQADLALAKQRKAERELLAATFSAKRRELYRMYLQERAQAGDVFALAELCRQRIEPYPHDTSTPQLVSGVGAQGKVVLASGGAMSYWVARDGDVTYRLGGRDVLRDEVRAVRFLDSSDNAVLMMGLRLALQKFGPALAVHGDEAFRRRVVQAVVESGLPVEFSDPVLNSYRQQLEVRRRPVPPAGRKLGEQNLAEMHGLPASPDDEPALPSPGI